MRAVSKKNSAKKVGKGAVVLTPSFSLLDAGMRETLFLAARLTWIGWDESAVEPKKRRLRVDEDDFLFAWTRVEEGEEWGE